MTRSPIELFWTAKKMIMMMMMGVMMKMEGNHIRRPAAQLTSHVKDRRAPFQVLGLIRVVNQMMMIIIMIIIIMQLQQAIRRTAAPF